MNPELILVAAIVGGIGGLGAFILGWQRRALRRSRIDPVVSSYSVSARRVLGTVLLTFVLCAVVPVIGLTLDTEREHALVVMLSVVAVALSGITASFFGPWLRHGALVLDRDARSLVLEQPGEPRLRVDLSAPYTLVVAPAPYPGNVVAVEVHQGETVVAFSYPWPELLDKAAERPPGPEANRLPGPRLDLAARGIHEALEP